MAILIVFVLLLAAGLMLAYRLSAPVAARKRAVAALEQMRSLRAELTMQSEGIKEFISHAATRLGQDIRSERLRAISIDTIKHHSAGLRLQALRDAGLNTVLDLQGWSAQRLSGIRGVGPKSAGSIAAVVQTLTHSSNSIPLRCPLPPFASVAERSLLCAVYIDVFSEARLSEQGNEFRSVLDKAEERLAAITLGTAFPKWLIGLFASEGASQARENAQALIHDLQEDPRTVALKQSIEESLIELRGRRNQEIPQEELMAAYEGDAPLYEWMMARALGSSESAERPISLQRYGPATVSVEQVQTLAPEPTLDAVATGPAFTLQQRIDSLPINRARAVPVSEGELSETVNKQSGRLVPSPSPIHQLPPAAHSSEPPNYAKTAAEALQQLHRVRAALGTGRTLEENAFPKPLAPLDELVTMNVGQPSESSGVTIPLPAKVATAYRKNTRWITPSDTVEIQGIEISGSYFFCGSPSRATESFVLDPFLAVARETQQVGEESANSYRYGSFTPHIRLRYLQWLAAGARDRDVPSGFGKLYFQGIERRLLQHLRKPEPDSNAEIEALIREVERIDLLFVLMPNSVGYQANSLLQFLAARAFVGSSMPALPPLSGRADNLLFQLRLGLGCFMKENSPIPAVWALRWAHAEPTIYLRTAPLRCPNEFEAAFRYLYGERYGQGLVIKPNKTMLSIEYQPLWSGGDDSKVQLTFKDVPDVKALTAPQSALRQLVSEATEMIDGYSRLLGHDVARAGTLESLLRLPAIIWSSEAQAALQQLRSTLVEPMLPATCQTIFMAFGGTGEIGSTRLMEFAKYLQKVGIGFEPDVLAGARKPKPADCVVLFPLAEAAEDGPSTSVKAATVTVTLAAILAIADGHASEEEATTVDGLIREWAGLPPNLRARLHAVYRFTVQQPPTLSSLKARLEALTIEDRKQVAMALTKMAASDGLISPEEVKLLEWVYRALALETQALYTDLHGASEFGPFHRSEAHSSLLKRSSEGLLDSSRLTRLRQQSSEVSELLAGVFAEEDDPVMPISVVQSTSAPPAPQRPSSGSAALVLPGLTPKDHHFVTLP